MLIVPTTGIDASRIGSVMDGRQSSPSVDIVFISTIEYIMRRASFYNGCRRCLKKKHFSPLFKYQQTGASVTATVCVRRVAALGSASGSLSSNAFRVKRRRFTLTGLAVVVFTCRAFLPGHLLRGGTGRCVYYCRM